MLTFKLDSPLDLLVKLRNDIKLLEDEVTSYRFFDMAVTGYHIIDWIKNNKSISMAAKKAVEIMYEDEYISICRDLANAYKHYEFKKEYQKRKLDFVGSQQGAFGTGRFGKGVYGIGEEHIIIKCLDGREYEVLDFAKELLRRWEAYFDEYSINNQK